MRRMRRMRAAPGIGAVALLVLATLAGCRAVGFTADISHKRVKIGDAAEATFGAARVSFLPAGGYLDSLSVRSCTSAPLTSATFRVYDDTDEDGVWSPGEPVHRYTATRAGQTLEFSSISHMHPFG